MAKVTLYSEDLNAPLPQVCMRCGAPATMVKDKRFSWGKEWLTGLLILGTFFLGIPFLAIMLLLLPFILWRRQVAVPLCEAHRNLWLPYQITMFIGLVILAGLATAIAYLAFTAKASWDPKASMAYGLGLGTIFFMIILIAVGGSLQRRIIRPLEITPDSITLNCVDERFIQAMEERDRQNPPRRGRQLKA